MMTAKSFNKINGFTLIEILITIGVLAVIMTALPLAIITFYQSQTFTIEQALAVNEARRGIKTMVKEIREARVGADGSYIIEKADDQEFIFFSDLDNDGYAERVRYFLENGEFKKGVVVASGSPLSYDPANESIITVSKYVINASEPLFTYYNGDWPGDTINNPLATPARLTETKLMKVGLMVNVNPSRQPETITINSNVQIRNLKTNL